MLLYYLVNNPITHLKGLLPITLPESLGRVLNSIDLRFPLKEIKGPCQPNIS